MKKKQNLKQFKSLLLFKINSFQLMFKTSTTIYTDKHV